MEAPLADSTPYVTGAAAILGALVGGAASGITTYKVEKSRQSHAISTREQEDAAQVRGIARAFMMQIARDLAHFETELDLGIWVPARFEAAATAADRQLLFRHLRHDTFGDLVLVELLFGQLDQVREGALARTPAGPPPKQYTDTLTRVRPSADRVIAALRDLTGDDAVKQAGSSHTVA